MKPVSLHTLLVEAFNSDDTRGIPSLRVRFQLAKQLATSLYQLQCSQWLHRNLSSHHVVFFYDKETGNVRHGAPFIIGLQYSRPDDQTDPSAQDVRLVSEGRGQRVSWGKLDLYLHPDCTIVDRRYRRSDDVYSLGIILFEIAFWEPVQIFLEESHSISKTAAEILEAAHDELAAEVGDFYRDAVVLCLEGLRKKANDESQHVMEFAEAYDGKYRGEDPEYGLEEDFLWNVVRQLEKCTA